MYWALLLDVELLMSDKNLDDLERCHDSITAQGGMPEVKKAVADWVRMKERTE